MHLPSILFHCLDLKWRVKKILITGSCTCRKNEFWVAATVFFFSFSFSFSFLFLYLIHTPLCLFWLSFFHPFNGSSYLSILNTIIVPSGSPAICWVSFWSAIKIFGFSYQATFTNCCLSEKEDFQQKFGRQINSKSFFNESKNCKVY